MLNIVALNGRLTHTPELKTTQNGTSVCSFSIAVDRTYTPKGEERKADFEQEGSHFVSGYFLTFLWLPPAEDAARSESWLYEGRERTGVDPHEILRTFVDRTDRTDRCDVIHAEKSSYVRRTFQNAFGSLITGFGRAGNISYNIFVKINMIFF